jgi:GNAT superfamily N-acetyltransferase
MIRFCNANDEVEWIRLNREFMAEEIHDLSFWNEIEKTSDVLFAATFRNALENPDHIKLLLVENEEGDAIGYANLMVLFSVWSHGQALEIDDLYIVPAERAKGIGSDTIKFCENYAKGNGFKRFQFKAEENNKGANHLYKRLGYVSEKMDFYVKYL